MSNGYFNSQTRSGLSGAKAPSPGGPSASMPPLKEKPGFSVELPGKAQPKDRSGGVERCKVSPSRKGL